MNPFPDDQDGHALRKIQEAGSDLSKPMDVEISIAAPDEQAANEIADLAASLGFRTSVFFDEDIEDVETASEPWTCECSRVMVLGYQSIAECQVQLNKIANPRGGYVDGWGTWGNA